MKCEYNILLVKEYITINFNANFNFLKSYYTIIVRIIMTEKLPKADHDIERERLQNQLADIDISITTRDHDTFKHNTIQLYEAIKKNCEHRGAVYINEVRTLASIKYKIYVP